MVALMPRVNWTLYSAVCQFFCLLVLCLLSGTCIAATRDLQVLAELQQDSDLLDHFWVWLKQETGAPDYLPAPDISIEPLPNNNKMALLYPTVFDADVALRVVISPNTLQRAVGDGRLLVLSELAHELVHYVLLLQEHDWQYALFRFNKAQHGHCDAEFQRLNRHIAEIIWQSYHSNVTVRAVDQLIQKACWESGHQLADKPLMNDQDQNQDK